MERLTRLTRFLALVGSIGWLAASCASPYATLEPSPTESIPRAQPTSAPPTEIPAPNPSWMELRDPVYKYGIAVPCWWWVIPTPAGGVSGTMSLHSYDEAYVQANSTKGWWNIGDYPPGVFKVDVGGWPVGDSTLSTYEAAVAAFTSEEQEVASAVETTYGRNLAVDLHTRSTANPDKAGRLIVFRLHPETILFVSASPVSAYETPDIQGILESLALTPDEAVVIPTFSPSQPVIPLPVGCPVP